MSMAFWNKRSSTAANTAMVIGAQAMMPPMIMRPGASSASAMGNNAGTKAKKITVITDAQSFTVLSAATDASVNALFWSMRPKSLNPCQSPM